MSKNRASPAAAAVGGSASTATTPTTASVAATTPTSIAEEEGQLSADSEYMADVSSFSINVRKKKNRGKKGAPQAPDCQMQNEVYAGGTASGARDDQDLVDSDQAHDVYDEIKEVFGRSLDKINSSVFRTDDEEIKAVFGSGSGSYVSDSPSLRRVGMPAQGEASHSTLLAADMVSMTSSTIMGEKPSTKQKPKPKSKLPKKP